MNVLTPEAIKQYSIKAINRYTEQIGKRLYEERTPNCICKNTSINKIDEIR